MVTYKRKPWTSLGLVVLGILFLLDVARDTDLSLLYDGVKLLVGVVQIGIGSWGLLTPLVSLRGSQLTIYESAFSSRTIDLSRTELVVEGNYLLFSGETEQYTFPFSQLQKSRRSDFLLSIRLQALKLA
ncbi:hypothetical protein [Cesiribacter andamanensis]|uniref:Uncharacterized protein n=1 Tax=Cesiribacter andamanensis AMV16 TaxID=1279009 RepID=M7NNK0_9BACT|nr:hypothetical protein [Cesiribacter andamanensis]EMR03275.1 hypothetical protein ADICEAN_01594 [Cesiribacter andamanensis AMV16]